MDSFLDAPKTNLVALPMYIWEDYLTSKYISDKLIGLWDCYQQVLDSDNVIDTFGNEGMKYFVCELVKKKGRWSAPETCIIFDKEYSFLDEDGSIRLSIGDFVNILWVEGVSLNLTTHAQLKFFPHHNG